MSFKRNTELDTVGHGAGQKLGLLCNRHEDFEDCCHMFQSASTESQDLSLLLEGTECHEITECHEMDGRPFYWLFKRWRSEKLQKMLPSGLLQGGFNEINLGRTATEIKSTYGAVARDNYFSFYTTKPLLKLVLRIAKKKYQPKEYTLRTALK